MTKMSLLFRALYDLTLTVSITCITLPFLPCCSALQDKVFQCVHDGSQGAGRAPYMGLQAQTAEKFADRPDSHTSFEAEHQRRGHDQTDQPGAARCRCPQRRLRVAVSTANCLKMAMHAAYGKPGVIRQAPDALFAVITNRIEDDNALGPQSHRVGPRSEGWLKSWKKSALQSTRSTTGCPGLSGCPGRGSHFQLGVGISWNLAEYEAL